MVDPLPPLATGARIGGYELVRRIGRGGMAEVWCAKRLTEHRTSKYVALKVVSTRYQNDPRFQRMFRSEAEISSVLNHINIVQVFDEGEDQGRSYLVMEWVDGVNLLKITAALSLVDDARTKHRIAAYIVGQLLYALSYAHRITLHDGHALGIVHRDVSPQNVLVSNNGEVKLTDFGVAHHALDQSSGLHVKGKVRYMAPEQLAGRTRDQRVDLYAVGAILHELLDGQRFRHRATEQRAMYLEVLEGSVPALSQSVPPELNALRLGLLQANPDDRIPTAEAALEQLEAYPGYGDARRDLMQLCGGLTGVNDPRVGPNGSPLVEGHVAPKTGTHHEAPAPAPMKEATDSNREVSTLTSLGSPSPGHTVVAGRRPPRRGRRWGGRLVVLVIGVGAVTAAIRQWGETDRHPRVASAPPSPVTGAPPPPPNHRVVPPALDRGPEPDPATRRPPGVRPAVDLGPDQAPVPEVVVPPDIAPAPPPSAPPSPALGSPPRSASAARRSSPTETSILTVAVEGLSGPLEVKLASGPIRTIAPQKSRSFRLPTRTHRVRWRYPADSSWNTQRVQVRRGCELLLRLPSMTQKTLGTCG